MKDNKDHDPIEEKVSNIVERFFAETGPKNFIELEIWLRAVLNPALKEIYEQGKKEGCGNICMRCGEDLGGLGIRKIHQMLHPRCYGEMLGEEMKDPIEEKIDEMVRDFTMVAPRPKSDVRRRIRELYEEGKADMAGEIEEALKRSGIR